MKQYRKEKEGGRDKRSRLTPQKGLRNGKG